ncbi:hypothetical protein [Natronosalvus rutilus]|uniref:Uncharacterized protein n=1 Tax=Natronosalvus rutilus TaxID=2953753 RepID=A0A9E7SX09_9EURY|nr:hypothetical protein [Natronosalvus rutilus]UTF55960.1 hypothetical protein NGM29_20935 [Natronosalvus rutilus]
MRHNGSSPFTHGMEIEQFPGACPREVRNYTMNNDRGELTDWHNDMSGPRETSIGAYKNCKTILNRFYADTRDEDITWDWHASHEGAGAGSHVHLCVAGDVFDDPITAWTISYNTVAEVFPFLAPFFCHNWEEGFRDGSQRGYGSSLNVEHWAEGQLTRYSQDSIESHVNRPRSFNRSYNSVTFNPAAGNKPVTIELRANDAHPAMALNGLLLIRRLTGRAIEGGWSPKLENHRATLEACYETIYRRAADVGLLTAMKEQIPGGITFQEDRGLPGIDKREFDTMWEVLRAIMVAFPQTPGTWRKRSHILVRSGRDEYGPQNNPDALWNFDAPRGEFEWDHGPEQED